MRIAYLINRYSRVGRDFIRQEMIALDRQGFKIVRIAPHGQDGEPMERENRLECDTMGYSVHGRR